MFTLLKLSVVVILVIFAIVILFGVVGFLAGAIWTIIKLAVIAGVIVVAAKVFVGSGRSDK